MNQMIAPLTTDKPSNGADPTLQMLNMILTLLTDLTDTIDELVEKVNDLSLTANDGFGYSEPES